jgi:hypothetical protein
MATYMMFYVAPDSHMEFLKGNPTAFDSYLAGEIPDLSQGFFSRLMGKQERELPDDWPSHELEAYSPEISHRQVNVFHYLLNGTNDFVENVGSVFQTWFKPRHNSPVIVIDGENFAFLSKDVRQLLSLIEGLTPELKRDRLDSSDVASEIQGGSDFVVSAFDVIEKACKEAVSKEQGLLWTNR